MTLTDVEAAVLRSQYTLKRTCTPETLAERLGITLGEVREAEKTALRKITPGQPPAGADAAELTPLESAVLRDCLAIEDTGITPEAIAGELGITLGEVLEAIKTGMSKLEDPAHATPATLEALGVQTETH